MYIRETGDEVNDNGEDNEFEHRFGLAIGLLYIMLDFEKSVRSIFLGF